QAGRIAKVPPRQSQGERPGGENGSGAETQSAAQTLGRSGGVLRRRPREPRAHAKIRDQASQQRDDEGVGEFAEAGASQGAPEKTQQDERQARARDLGGAVDRDIVRRATSTTGGGAACPHQEASSFGSGPPSTTARCDLGTRAPSTA